ncbi:precorrin-2 dehydrogenase/sirohydrochlorin ferrochelatase family protein [Reichenbachiella versicolor]|uniref:precorrin-2 dehydrogenase/sirohydrochlorin ferrochelatase family protein n=1 Tax=Reichenbachiella versicolor TaxID=1821036 RepID=UPI000D6E85B0|nr:bifunctional precorrin-2 dehydrogenase/sirohydrochlorin ferrochelatase [Reichenbachiella versicolor]
MSSPAEFGNNLMPVFLKLEELDLLIVGGGFVGMEKLSAVLTNSPETRIKLVAKEISDEIKEKAKNYSNLKLVEKPYEKSDLDGAQVAICGIDDPEISGIVAADAKEKRVLVNIADKPELCDFYLSSVVKKGDLKIGISTNGKSPTVAKRVKEFLNDSIPDSIDDILENMTKIREQLKGDFEYKVNKLNAVTSVWSDDRNKKDGFVSKIRSIFSK